MRLSVPHTFLDAMAAGEAEAPWFARMAQEFLSRGEPSKAAQICQEGLRRHPDYGTGYLVLGKCYAALGRNREALLALRRVRDIVPDNPQVRSLVAEREAREDQEFEEFCARRRADLGVREPITLEEFFSGRKEESSVDYLLKQLEEVRKQRPREKVPDAEGGPGEEDPVNAKIITVTLAEIYVSQGQIAEAIKAYRKLMELRPDDAARFTERIGELEQRLRDGA